MAQITKFQYWDGSRWKRPLREEQEAYLGCVITDLIGHPTAAAIRIQDTPINPYSSTVADRKGYFNGVFTEFMDVRITDIETHSILFAGKIYNVEEEASEITGTELILTCVDSLRQLQDFETDSWRHTADNLEGFSDDLTKRSDVITRAVRNAGIIDIEDTIREVLEVDANELKAIERLKDCT